MIVSIYAEDDWIGDIEADPTEIPGGEFIAGKALSDSAIRNIGPEYRHEFVTAEVHQHKQKKGTV